MWIIFSDKFGQITSEEFEINFFVFSTSKIFSFIFGKPNWNVESEGYKRFSFGNSFFINSNHSDGFKYSNLIPYDSIDLYKSLIVKLDSFKFNKWNFINLKDSSLWFVVIWTIALLTKSTGDISIEEFPVGTFFIFVIPTRNLINQSIEFELPKIESDEIKPGLKIVTGTPLKDAFSMICSATHFDFSYEKSKWVAEQIIEKASFKGVPVTIFRPGLISSDSILGSSNSIDWFIRFLVGITKMKKVPTGNSSIEMSPVDFVSKAIVHITTNQREESFKLMKFHLLNLNESNFTINDLYKSIESYGIKLEYLKPSEWFELMKKELPKENLLYPSLSTFQFGFPNMNEKIFDVENTKKLISNSSDVICPNLSEKIIHNTLKWLENKKI